MKQLLLSKSEAVYVKHYFQKETRLGAAVLIILGLLVLGYILPSPILYFGLSLFGGTFDIFGDTDSGNLSLVFLAICILAYVLPLYIFRFLMSRSGNDLYLSLPIERKRLFYVHYLIGLIYLVSVSFFLLIIFCMFSGIDIFSKIIGGYFPAIMIYFLLNCGFILLGCCLYTFFTYIIIRCHTLLDGIIMGIIYTVLPLFFYYAASALCEHVINDTLVSVAGNDNTIEGFLDLLVAALSIPWQMNLWIKLYCYHELTGVYTLELLILCGIVWLIIAAVCLNGAAKRFMRIRSEQSGQTTSAFITYPLLIPLITFFLLIGFQGEAPISIATAAIAVCYLLADFFAERKIRFSFKRLVLFPALALSSYLLFMMLSSTQMFGTLQEIPSAEQVESVVFDITQDYQENFNHTSSDSQETDINYYPNYTGQSSDPQKIASFIECHRQLVSLAKQHNSESYSGWRYYISFTYTTKNHQNIARMYLFREQDMEHINTLLKELHKQALIQKITE